MPNKAPRWTDTEIELLKKYYPAQGSTSARRHLPGRTQPAINTKAKLLGLKCPIRGAWSEEEIALLREYWPQGGFLAVAPHLPGRTRPATNNMALRLGIRAPMPVGCRGEASRHYLQDDSVDAAIVAAYQARKSVKALAFKLGRPEGWVKYRALNLGVRIARQRNPAWTDEELNILWERGGRSLATIQKSLARQGYQRSQHAIKTILHKRGIDTTPDNYTASEFSRLMGVCDHVVIGWIQKGWLKARKYQRLAIDNVAPGRFWITPSAARAFIIESVAHINLGKCDKYWLVDLLDGKYNGNAVKGNQEAA